MDVAEIGFEAFGELGSPEAIIPSFRNATYEIDGERVTKIDVIDIINGQPDIKEDNTEYIEILNNITIKNDIGLQNEKDKLYKKETTKNEVLKGLTEEQKQGITDKQIESLVNETIELKNYESSNTPPGNENAAKTREKIKQITDAIQEPSTEEISPSQQPETSPAVGTGDTQGAAPAGETPSEQAETSAQPAEEVETQVEDDASEVIAGQDVRKIGEFEVTFSDENKIVEVKKNGKVVPEKSRTNIEKKLIEQGQINLMPNEEVEVEGITNPVKVTEKILEESNNPGEIAGAIENVENLKKEQKELLKEVKQSGLESLFGTKFTPESIVKVTGLKISELGKGFRNTWVSKTGQNIEDGFIDDNGNVFEVNEVVEFIQENPNVTTFNNKLSESTTQLVKDLKEKFKELTGIRATKGNLKAARETTPESIQELATTEMAEVKKAEAEKPIIEKKKKQTKPKKEKTKEEPTEIDKTVDELGTKGVDKIDAKILRLNFGNAYAYIKNTLARGKGVINVMQEQLRSAPTTAVDYILGNENSTLFYRKLFLPLVKSYQQYADRFRQKEKIILESQDSLLKESKGDRNKAKINGYRIAIAQKAKIHEANPDSDVTPPVLDMLNFTIRLGKAGKLMGVNRKTALALEKLRDEYIKDGGITFENVYNSLSPTQKKVYNLLQEENSKLEPFALKAAERRGLTLEMLNDYSHRVVVGTRNEEIDIADKQAKDFSGETTRGKNLLERTEGVKAVSFDPFLSSLRGTQEVYLDYYMSPDVSNVQKIAAGLVKKYENGNDGQVAATIGIEETIRELLRVSYLRSFVPSGYGTTIATEAKRIGYRLLLGSAPRFAAELAGNSAMLMAEKPSVVMDAITKYGSFSMKVGAKANNKYINMLTELGSGETDKLGGRLEADSKYSDRSGILNISQGERGLYNNFLNKLDQLTRLPKKLTYDNIAKASDFLMAGGDRTISRPIWVSKFANEFKENVKQEFGENIDITVKDLDEIAEGESKYLTDSKYKKAIDKAVRDADRTVISISTSANPFNAIAKNVKRGDVKDYYRTINSFMANFTLNEYATARQAIGALVNSGEMSSRRAGFLLAGVLARMSSYVIAYGILADLLDEEILNAPDDDDEELDSLIYRQLIGSVMTLMFRQNLGNIPSLPVNLGIEEFNKQYLDELRDGKPYNSYDNSIVYSLITLDRLDKGIDKQILPILTGPYVEYYKTARRAIELYNRTQTRKTKEARDRAVKELEEVIVPQIIGQLGFIPLYKDYIRSKRKKFYAENYDRSSGSSGGGGSLPAER